MSESLSLLSPAAAFRRRYPVAYKRQVVEESMAAGASIARVALAHGINANLLHNWRWQYRRGDFDSMPLAQSPALLPVQLSAASAPPSYPPARVIDAHAGEAQPSSIELFFTAARVVIHGQADAATLRGVIEVLRS